MGGKQQQSGSVIMSLCILHSTSHHYPFFFGSAVLLNYISYSICIPITDRLVFIVITTMLVIIVTLITITVLPKLTLFWV